MAILMVVVDNVPGTRALSLKWALKIPGKPLETSGNPGLGIPVLD
jgi:hypothetical protein